MKTKGRKESRNIADLRGEPQFNSDPRELTRRGIEHMGRAATASDTDIGKKSREGMRNIEATNRKAQAVNDYAAKVGQRHSDDYIDSLRKRDKGGQAGKTSKKDRFNNRILKRTR